MIQRSIVHDDPHKRLLLNFHSPALLRRISNPLMRQKRNWNKLMKWRGQVQVNEQMIDQKLDQVVIATRAVLQVVK
jgi:hypothetical protein